MVNSMKKMQCEVCGGNEIKKISATIFECQSCGVQYSTEEVKKLFLEITGEVKIDRSVDAENMVKRAKQFEKRGNKEKANEYYEKALDYDADNAEALSALNYDSSTLEDMYVLEKNINKEETLNNFFLALSSKENIAPDFFTDFEIINCTEKYFPFSLCDCEVKGTFTGTSCYRIEVPYTDYEEKRERLSNGQWVTKKVPVTKYRTEIDKKPASGSFESYSRELYSISGELNTLITSTKAKDIDKIKIPNGVINDEKICEAVIFKDMENCIKSIVNKNNTDFSLIYGNELIIDGEKLTYKGCSMSGSAAIKKDLSWAERATKQFSMSVLDDSESACRRNCPGDLCEDIRYTEMSRNEQKSVVFIPICIIKYAYKGDFYIAVLIQHSCCKKLALTYPKDMAVNNLDLQLEEKEGLLNIAKGKENTLKGFDIPIMACGVIGILVVYLGILGGQNFIASIFISLGVAATLIVILHTIANSIVGKASQAVAEVQEKIKEKNEILVTNIGITYSSFIKIYSSSANFSDAVNAAKKVSKITLNANEHTIAVSRFENLASKTKKSKKAKMKFDVDILNVDEEAKERIADALKKHKKIEAIQILKENTGCSLAEAKEFVDKCSK